MDRQSLDRYSSGSSDASLRVSLPSASSGGSSVWSACSEDGLDFKLFGSEFDSAFSCVFRLFVGHIGSFLILWLAVERRNEVE